MPGQVMKATGRKTEQHTTLTFQVTYVLSRNDNCLEAGRSRPLCLPQAYEAKGWGGGRKEEQEDATPKFRKF